jgi:hypothetical protein
VKGVFLFSLNLLKGAKELLNVFDIASNITHNIAALPRTTFHDSECHMGGRLETHSPVSDHGKNFGAAIGSLMTTTASGMPLARIASSNRLSSPFKPLYSPLKVNTCSKVVSGERADI